MQCLDGISTLAIYLIIRYFLQVKSEGMEILRQEERTLTKEEAAEFYKQHEGSEHFEDLVEFMSRYKTDKLKDLFTQCSLYNINQCYSSDKILPQLLRRW